MTASFADDLQRAFGDRYRIERELGGGGMSRVFVAEERALARTVVIKILPRELAAALSVERFRREIQLAAQLQHPHVVPVLAAGDVDGLPWFTMPFVTGEALEVRLARGPLLPLRDAVAILRDVAAALEYAHARGIVHRDIKPANVLLSGRTAVVTDFGIAKAISASRTAAPGSTLTQAGTALGTPAYMAPEQAAADPGTDARADLYAWGVMAFEVLSGRLPFVTSSPHELLRAHLLEVPPPLTALRGDLPTPLVDLVARCLEKRPEDRPADAAELMRVLETVPIPDALASATPSAAPATAAGLSRQLLRPLLIGAALLIAAVAGLRYQRRAVTPTAVDQRVPAPPAFDPALVLLVPIRAEDSALGSASALATDAVSRELGTLRYAQVSVAASAGTGDRRAEAAAGRMATILDGRLHAIGDSLQLDLRLTDAASGRLIRTLPSIRLGRADPSRGIAAALAPTKVAVGIVTHPMLGPAALPYEALPRLAALHALEQALMQRSFIAELEGLNRVVQEDSTWRLSRIMRAVVYLGYSRYYDDARTRSRYLAELPGPDVPLTPYEAALRDAALAANEAAPEGPLAAFRRVQRIAPGAFGRAEYIVALENANRPREALEQLQRVGPFVRELEAPAGTPLTESAGYWLETADLRHYIGDHAGERFAAERSAAIAGQRVGTLARRGAAYAALGDSAAVDAVVAAAEVISSDPRPNLFGGEVLLIVSQELIAHGHPAHGAQVLDRALRWFEAHRGERLPGDSTPRIDLAFREALALRAAGRNADALVRARSLAALELKDTRLRSFYGRVQGAMGNQLAADSVDAWLATVQQDPATAGNALVERAFLAAARGQRDAAIAFLREAFARGGTFNIRRNLHRYNDWAPFKGYAPYEALVTPDG